MTESKTDDGSRESRPIERAAVLGAGTMGAAIAAHIANAGIPCLLLDIKPDSGAAPALPSRHDQADSADRVARAGLERAKKAKPAAFYRRDFAARIEVGNFEDDLGRLAEVDWIVEAIIEDLDIKQRLYERIGAVIGPQTIVSSNTSGLSAARLAECLPEEARSRFLVTHFFNPPRYLKLLELVATPSTDPAVLQGMAEFGARRLGKGIVYAKDTPNFIGNRIGVFSMLHAVKTMVEGGYSVVEVDKLTGRALGRPKSATFRTADVVGIDVLALVAGNMYDSLPDDSDRDLFQPPAFVRSMIERQWLGAKSGQGFYKKIRSKDGSEILMIDPESLEYVPQPKVTLASLEMARNVESLRDRLRMLVAAPDRGGQFLWKNLSATLSYAARAIPEISDDIFNVDRALRWGFGRELGPFETWDAIGVRRSCERMSKEGFEVPPVAEQLLSAGKKHFYELMESGRSYFDLSTGDHQPVPRDPRVHVLADLKRAGKAVMETPDCTLVDMDEVACLEFHTKMNTIGPGVIEAMEKSIARVERDWRGLVIGNNGDHFSAGANLLLILNEVDDDNLDDVEWIVRRFQQVNQKLRFSRCPVVVATHGMTLGGGCEVSLGADRVCAAAETYMGLVELGAGVIPAGGGCKELVKRAHESVPEGVETDLFPFIRRVFETVGMARVSTSAPEAQALGYLREDDKVVVNRDHLLDDAKNVVLSLAVGGYRPPRPLEDIRVLGEPGLSAIRAGLHNMRASGFISEYDQLLGDRLAWVLCGGEVSASSRVSEDYLLDLERVAFLELCENPKTQERMEHILRTGKPLRN